MRARDCTKISPKISNGVNLNIENFFEKAKPCSIKSFCMVWQNENVKVAKVWQQLKVTLKVGSNFPNFYCKSLKSNIFDTF